MSLRIAEADGHNFVVLYDDVDHAAFADADIGCAFFGDRWDGVQDVQGRAAEGTVYRRGCVHAAAPYDPVRLWFLPKKHKSFVLAVLLYKSFLVCKGELSDPLHVSVGGMHRQGGVERDIIPAISFDSEKRNNDHAEQGPASGVATDAAGAIG